jgi:predicted RNase H-like nuclease (RuvC/YqgF family)
VNTDAEELKRLFIDEHHRQEVYRQGTLDWRIAVEQRLGNQGVIEQRISTIEKSVEKMADAIKELTASIAAMAKLEAKQVEIQTHIEKSSASVTRAFAAIEKSEAAMRSLISDHETRVRALESEMPTTKLTRGWILSGMVFVITAVGAALIGLVLK